MKRAEGNLLMATNARAKYANKIFKPETVATAIDELAFQGHRRYRIVQELPFDLSDTEAARALEKWLDGEEFRYVWQAAPIEADGLRRPTVTEHPELEIYW